MAMVEVHKQGRDTVITTEYSGYGYIGLPSELTAQQYLLFRRYLVQRIQQEKSLTKVFGQSNNELLERFLPDNTGIRLEGLCRLQEQLVRLESNYTDEQMGKKIIPILKVMFRDVLNMFNGNTGRGGFPSDLAKLGGHEWTEEEADTIDTHVAVGGAFASYAEAEAAAYDMESVLEILRLVTDASIDHDPEYQRRNSYLLREWNAIATGCGDSHLESRPLTGADILPELENYCVRRVMYEAGGYLPADFLALQAANASFHIAVARLHFGIQEHQNYWAKVVLLDEEKDVSESFEYCSWKRMMSLLDGKKKRKFIQAMQKSIMEGIGMMGVPRNYDRGDYIAPYQFQLERSFD